MEDFAAFLQTISSGRLLFISCRYVYPMQSGLALPNCSSKIFVASLVAVVFYSLVFLIIRGTLAFRGGLKFNLDLESRRSTMYCNTESPKFIAALARSMLWYPFGKHIPAITMILFP